MRLSEESKDLFIEFFYTRGFCEKEDFPEIRVYCRLGASIITTLIAADGITIGRRIFVRPAHVGRNSDSRLVVSRNLLAHEIVHVMQYKQRGFAGFATSYVAEFWKIFRRKERWTAKSWFEAYEAIPDEVEARQFASEFETWSITRKTA
jgi:hypothetical protein